MHSIFRLQKEFTGRIAAFANVSNLNNMSIKQKAFQSVSYSEQGVQTSLNRGLFSLSMQINFFLCLVNGFALYVECLLFLKEKC